MRTQSIDTHPDIERIMIERLRTMTSAEKTRQMVGMIQMAERSALKDVIRRYPKSSEQERKMRVASRRLPAELMQRVFGWDVQKEGY